MRLLSVLVLNCFCIFASFGSETETALRPEVAAELTRATGLERAGDVREAERILLNVIRGEGSGAHGIESALALNNLGVLYVTTGRYADAERQFKRSIQLLERLESGELLLAKTKLHLAHLYVELGRTRDAMKLNLPLLAGTLSSPEDQTRLTGALAAIAAARNELVRAEQMYLQALSFWTHPSRAGGSRLEIAGILNNLGVIALWQGQTDVARERLYRSYGIWQEILGPASPDLAKALSNIASVCMRSKQYAAAAEWLEQGIGIVRKTLGELHPSTVAMQFAYAEALQKAGRKAEAREIARSAREARSMVPSPSTSSYTVDYRDMLPTLRR